MSARLGRVLVVEDDPGISSMLVKLLTRAGYETGHVSTGTEALAWPEPDVVLLDLGLPDIDGVEVCRRMRPGTEAGIIVVTARGEEEDRVQALDEGADDYIVKPFGMKEVLARIRAVMRRKAPAPSPVQPPLQQQPRFQPQPALHSRLQGQPWIAPGYQPPPAPEPPAPDPVIRHGILTVDPRTRRVTVAGRPVALTPKEFAILECLASDPGRVVSRHEMLERAWDEHWYGPTKVLDVHMAALRRKLGIRSLVETVYGHGFRLADPETHPNPNPQPHPNPQPQPRPNPQHQRGQRP